MSIVEKTLHEEKLDALALSYEKEGFAILKEPVAEDLPFDLDGYRPDLIASKGNSGIIVEIKTSAERISVDRFQWIAQEISNHPGWRFMLVTLDDVDAQRIPTTATDLPTWPQLMDKLRQVELMVKSGVYEPALLYLWGIFEAALRKRAIQQNIPVERLPSPMLLNHMYSQGEISIEQIDSFQQLMEKRNRIAHGGNEVVEAKFATAIVSAVAGLLTEWSFAETGLAV